jgi:hypothetical protein
MLVVRKNTPARNNGQLVTTSGKVPEQLKQYVKAALGKQLELQKYDLGGQYPLTPLLNPFVMNLIPSANREGQVVNYDSIRFSWSLEDGGVTPVITYQARVLVFEWKSLSVPTAANILESPGAATGINSPYKFSHRQFYRIISDEVIMVNPNCAVGKHVTKIYKLGGSKKRYDDGVVPSATLGLMYVLAISDDPTINAPTWNYNIRTLFTDA